MVFVFFVLGVGVLRGEMISPLRDIIKLTGWAVSRTIW